MGIRKTIQDARQRFGAGDSAGSGSQEHAGIAITDAARDKILHYLADKDQEGLVFRVMTVPAKIGFTVQVGFDVVNKAPHREEFPEFPVVVSPEDWERLQGFTIDVREDRFVTLAGIRVQMAETPNPDARKFVVNRTVMREGSATFDRSRAGDGPVLPDLLFRVDGVEMLFCMQNFVTVTRRPEVSWDELAGNVANMLQAYFAHGGNPLAPQDSGTAEADGVEGRIVRMLEDYIRPQVQRDGGDILFAGYHQGTVSLHMQGSCVGCPSSTATLKMGIENLLKEAIPEVQEVVAVS